MVSTIIPFEGVMNIRDLGGMKTKDGRVITRYAVSRQPADRCYRER